VRTTIEFFKSVELLDFDQVASDRYAELRGRKIRIGTKDLRIAAVVVAAQGILVTRNRRDFERVPGLRIEDWSKP
jgi:tRNA(fMet)-specific endonuclease VapC